MDKNTFNNLPLYTATLNDDDLGIYTISLVEWPAMEKRWEFFEKQKEPLKFSVVDAEQHRVVSPIIRCDYPILRKDENGKFFYITFPKETIYAAAERFLTIGAQGLVKLTHNEDAPFIDGFNLVQWYIKDTARGISPVGFEDVADGSLFAEYYVTNEDVWKKVVDGTFNGLSMESEFFLKLQEPEEKEIDSIEALVDYLGIG